MGDIFEVDQVIGGSYEKDYLIFTVKNKTFNEFFELERNFKTGDQVYSIGNALGEGIVVRNGLILGTIPEEDSGRWNLLKSSADGNPGNSGGPLVTPDGKVVAVVTALRDNILYSIPAEVVLNGSRTELFYRIKPRFGHLLLANNLNHTFEVSVPLPGAYTTVRQKICELYRTDYNNSMSALFKEAPEYLKGPNNVYLLNSTLSSIFPEVSFVDRNDSNWKLSDFDTKSYNLDNDGKLFHAAVSGVSFYKIKRPKSVTVEKISSDPKYIMDLILQNIRTDRTLWGNDKYRILSYGNPSSTGQFKDALGRTWYTAYWIIGFEDKVQIMYILPLPNGPAVISIMPSSCYLEDYEWDMKKICDHIYAAYDGTFQEWTDFIALKKYIPDFLSDLRFNWISKEQNFTLSFGPVSVKADKNVFDWSNESELFLSPSWYIQKNKLEYSVRKIIVYSDVRGKEIFILNRNIKPDPKLGSKTLENWNDLAAEKYPFDMNPAISVKDNTGSIGAVIKSASPDPDIIHSLYLSMENPLNDDNLNKRFNSLKQGIAIKY
jgi:hypothetical protein